MTRAGAGRTISTTIELRRLDRAAAAALAVRTISAHDTYKSTTVGEGVYQFSRVYRPRWASISGWVLTIGLLGAGYWLLLIKRTEACTMWITEDRATVRVILAGGLLPDVYERVLGAFDEIEQTTGPSSEVNDPERAAFTGDDQLSARVFRSAPRVPPAVIDLNALQREEAEANAKTEVDPFTSPTPPAPLPVIVMDLPEVRFETGEHVRVMGVVYVGRDPMHVDANGKEVEWLAITDATGAVGKTHFAMGANLQGLWIEDLFSATGTAVGVDARSARKIKPLERVQVAIGETIFFGDLSALVLEHDDAATSVSAFRPSSRV
ncbi:MAG TPA: hypothetical protein VIK61_00865 [Acidimicrobiia bacterium]